jgi:dolichol-phosphate mannosyltransferase
VIGSRYVEGGSIANWPRLRRLLSRFGSLYARLMLGVQVRDLTSGFRCVRRRVLETVEPSTLRAQGYVFNIELTYRTLLAGFDVREVPICFRDRKAGDSKMSLPIAFEALMLVPKLRWPRLAGPLPAATGAERAGEPSVSEPADGSMAQDAVGDAPAS